MSSEEELSLEEESLVDLLTYGGLLLILSSFAGHHDHPEGQGAHLPRAPGGGCYVHGGHGTQLGRWQGVPSLSRGVHLHQPEAPLPELRPGLLWPVHGQAVSAAKVRNRKGGEGLRRLLRCPPASDERRK